MNRHTLLSRVKCQGQAKRFLFQGDSKVNPVQIGILALLFLPLWVKLCQHFHPNPPLFQGLYNLVIKISSKQKLGMQSFSLRVNFFFHKLSKGEKKKHPALWLFLLFFLRHKNRKQKCTACALFWNSYKNIYRPLRGMSVLGVLQVFLTDDFIRLTSSVPVR